MRYWTTIKFTEDTSKNNYTFDKKHVMQSHAFLENQCEPEDPHAVLVLVSPTADDLKALGNAFMYKYEAGAGNHTRRYYGRSTSESEIDDANTWLVFSPEMVDEVLQPMRAAPMSEQSWGYNREKDKEEVTKRQLTVIKDGEMMKEPCLACDKMLEHAVDACTFPTYNCSVLMFTHGTKMTMPDKSLYVPLDHCTDYVDFAPRTINHLHTTLTAATATETLGRDSDINRRAWNTRRWRETCCSVCMFSCEDYKCYMSGEVSKHGAACKGPYLEGDLNKLGVQTRKNASICGVKIKFEEFKAWAKKNNVPRKSWRRDPELKLTGRFNTIGEAEVMQTRGVYGGGQSIWSVYVSLNEMLPLREKITDNNRLKVVTIKDPLHHLLMRLYECNGYDIPWPDNFGNGGFGGCRFTGVFCGVYPGGRWQGPGGFTLEYMKDRYKDDLHIPDLPNMVRHFYHDMFNTFECSDGTVLDRREHILPLLETGKEGVAHVRKFLHTLVNKSNAGEPTFDIVNEGLPAVK